jgi:hypothetical protein
VSQRSTIEDVLQPLAQKVADGEGSDGVNPIVRSVGAALILELWVKLTALVAGGPIDFILESTLDDQDPNGWVEVLRIVAVAAVGTKASAIAKRGAQPLGQKVRVRWEFTGGPPDATFEARLLYRE